MMKLCNYISYCLYSFIPLYLFFILYFIYKDEYLEVIILVIIAIIATILLLYMQSSRPNSIFVCNYKEVKKINYIDFNYFLFVVLFVSLWLIKFNVFMLLIVLLAIFCILYKLNFIFLSYTLLLLNYKCYNIRGKFVYSKKQKNDLLILLKKQNYLQVKELSDNIYVEDECYFIKRDFCLK